MLIARRGAHFTYDAESYASFVKDLHRYEEVSFPTFSHAAKDPVKDGGIVRSNHRIV
jgi:pantothenate kinase